MVKVYAVNVSGLDTADGRLLKRMSERRLEKINRARVESVKKQSMGAELAINYALSREIDMKPPIEWETDENGKLFVPDADIHVNLSHSGDYAVCAVCGSAVGVDIEQVKTADLAIAKRFFTAEEYEYVKSSASPDEAFYEIWVKKESFIKAAGKGFAIPLSGFSVLDETLDYEGVTYRFKQYAVSDKTYKLYVCFAV